LTVAYDGTGFIGSQRQGTKRTVQAVLEDALAQLGAGEPNAVFAGRTDRGVHAAGQVVSCLDPRPELEQARLRSALNSNLPPDVAVVQVERVQETFHARYDAVWREYRYRMWSGVRQPLVARSVVHLSRAIDWRSMATASEQLVGELDVAAFAGGGEGVPWSERKRAPRGTRRNLFRCDVRVLPPWWGAGQDDGTLVELRVVADGFLPKMVRTIAGTLIEIGQGSYGVERVQQLLTARDRRIAGKTAPAHGLTLWRVGYSHQGWEAFDSDAIDESRT
jgi:tRNA pseudouridine38-40 synthase